ncbi:MAG: hypothetical protein ACYTDT_03580 [Planctomycetota bacterium]|jgi:type II secretory pathway component GspD/PulD (secretin)
MKKFVAAAIALSLLGTPVMADKDDANYRKLETALKTTVIDSFSFEDTDIVDVVKTIAKKSRINIVFDKAAIEDMSEDDRLVTIELTDIKAQNALKIVLDQVGLYQSFRHGVVYITTEEDAVEATSLKTYDVRDITVIIRDFPSPRIRLKGADDVRGPEYYVDEEKIVEADDIVDMIEETIDADWGGAASISKVMGQLVIRATRSTHQEIAGLLSELRSGK